LAVGVGPTAIVVLVLFVIFVILYILADKVDKEDELLKKQWEEYYANLKEYEQQQMVQQEWDQQWQSGSVYHM
jgi:predicted Holliday junction resolvase-like endonuclease